MTKMSENRKLSQQKYRLKNRVSLLNKRKLYYNNNKEKLRLEGRERYADPSNKIREKASIQENKRLDQWDGLIPLQTNCMVCNKPIFFRNTKQSIMFDHRHDGGEPIKGKPNNWLRSHKRTDDSEDLWIKSDFGHLCRKCNLYLPTDISKRKKLVCSLVKYVFNEFSSVVEIR